MRSRMISLKPCFMAPVTAHWDSLPRKNIDLLKQQDKCCHARLHQGQPFNMSISDAMVFGQDNPAALPGLGEPVFILCIRGKVVVVDVECGACLTKRCGHALLSQRSIEEEDERFRRLRRRVRT